MSDRDQILGPETDHHDAGEAFDDVDMQAQAPLSKEAQVRAVRAVVKQAQRSRISPPALKVDVADGEVGEIADSNDEILGELLGIGSSKSGAFVPTISADFPITQNLYQKFKSALPAPKIVRVDTEESYVGFMGARRAPHIEELERRLNDLEQAYKTHLKEQHGGLSVKEEDLEVMGAEIEVLRERAMLSGERVPLSLPPSTADNVIAWQDGEQIYCSMRLPGPDGKARIATTCTPASRHVEEVLGYATDANVDPVEIMGTLQTLAQVLGAGGLVTQLARAAPDLLTRPEVVAGKVFVGRVAPEGEPTVASVMALLQLCHKGDVGAREEAKALSRMPGGDKLFAAAAKGLANAAASRRTKGHH